MEIPKELPVKVEKKTLDHFKNAYADIVLTDEEREIALYEARLKKHTSIVRSQYWDRVRSESSPKDITAVELWNELKADKDFIIDKDNKKIVIQLCYYFTNDKRFEREGRSLKKGLIIFGGVGGGKTYLMRKFSTNKKQSYNLLRCNFIAGEYSKTGEEGIEKYFHPSKSVQDIYGFRQRGYCFDDLGTEKSKKYFGNSANVMQEIILAWHHIFEQTGVRIHLTTNLTAQQVKDIYDDEEGRFSSRLRQMFNVLIEESPDRRK